MAEINSYQGVSQSDRKLASLSPDYFHVDERTITDLVQQLTDLSEEIDFYGENGEVNGTWRDLFKVDVTLQLYLLKSKNIEKSKGVLRSHLNAFLLAQQRSQQIIGIGNAIRLIVRELAQIHLWKLVFHKIEPFQSVIQHLEASDFQKQLAEFWGWIEALVERFELELPPSRMEAHAMLFIDPIIPVIDESRVDYIWKEQAVDVFLNFSGELFLLLEEWKDKGKRYLEKVHLPQGTVKPHVGLFLSFVKIFSKVQKEMNGFTADHFDFFLSEVLGVKPRGITPSSVHVCIELAPNISEHFMEKGTRFLVESQEDNQVFFELPQGVVINDVKIEKIGAIVHGPQGVQLNEFGEKDNLIWYHISSHSAIRNLSERIWGAVDENYIQNQGLGFALSSPTFAINSGVRKFELRFRCSKYSVSAFQEELEKRLEDFFVDQEISLEEKKKWLLQDSLVGSYSNENGFNPIDPSQIEIQATGDGISVSILFGEDLTIGNLPPEFQEYADTTHPIFRFHMRPEKGFLFDAYNELEVNKVQVNFEGIGIHDLQIQNDFGALDQSAPFEPFGSIPAIGSSFYIGHPVLFHYPLKDIKVTIEWYDLPDWDEGFIDHYDGYGIVESNYDFKILISILKNGSWVPKVNKPLVSLFQELEENELLDEILGEDTEHFKQELSRSENNPISKLRRINELEASDFSGTSTEWVEPNEFYSKDSSGGYLKMELAQPSGAFGHKLYPELLTREVLRKSRLKGKKDTGSLQEPYTPKVKSVAVDISFSHEIDVSSGEKSVYLDKLWTLAPLERDRVWFKSERRFLMNKFELGTHLFLGLKNLSPPQPVNIYFKLKEAGTDIYQNPNSLVWKLFDGENWLPVDRKKIISDSTKNLTQTGIIQFQFDPEDHFIHRRFGEQALWVYAHSESGKAFFENIEEIRTQGVLLDLVITDDISELPIVAPNTIKDLENPSIKVQNVIQPFPSFGGRSRESKEEFFVRISERLRHRNRAIQTWDFERIAMEEFPSISHLKAIPHFDPERGTLPGCVTLVVIPKASGAEDPNDYPLFSKGRVKQIEDYFKELTPLGVKLFVRNPIYERVQLSADIKFFDGKDGWFFIEKLEKEIIEFLNPWSKIEASNNFFGQELHKSHVLNFIEKREYVDYISNFKLFHLIDDQIVNHGTANIGGKRIEPGSPMSILVSAKRHLIRKIDVRKPESSGIESFGIENDFLIQSRFEEPEVSPGGIGDMMIEDDARIPDPKVEGEFKTTFTLVLNL